MGRVKTADTKIQKVVCIQFVRNAISDVYTFLPAGSSIGINISADDKVTGTIKVRGSESYNVKGKDWIIKDPETDKITVCSSEQFDTQYELTGDA